MQLSNEFVSQVSNAEINNFPEIPQGKYIAHITRFDELLENGEYGVRALFKIVDGNQKGATALLNIWLKSTNAAKQQVGSANLKRIFEQCHLPVAADLNVLLNKPLAIEIVHKHKDGKKYVNVQLRNEAPANGRIPAQAAAQTAAPTPVAAITPSAPAAPMATPVAPQAPFEPVQPMDPSQNVVVDAAASGGAAAW